MPRIAVRGASFLAETHYWRDNVFRKAGGGYLQVALQLPRSTMRFWYEQTHENNYAGITPSFAYNAARVGNGWVPPPEVINRHIGYNKAVPTLGLRDFLGETTANGTNAAASILNGQLNLRNVSSWLVQKEWTPLTKTFGSSFESRWTRAFSTLVKYMYRDEQRDMDYNRGATLYPAGYRLTDINNNAVTTDDWTVVMQAPGSIMFLNATTHSGRPVLWNGACGAGASVRPSFRASTMRPPCNTNGTPISTRRTPTARCSRRPRRRTFTGSPCRIRFSSMPPAPRGISARNPTSPVLVTPAAIGSPKIRLPNFTYRPARPTRGVAHQRDHHQPRQLGPLF